MMGYFRTLRADEIECRINQIGDTKENGQYLTLLLYKTARTDATLLDETVGPARWENDFKLIDGVLYGGIGVDYDGNGNFVWKWDAGVESNTEAEKGRASDAYKRAGSKHGIGRALYTSPDIVLFANSGLIHVTKNDKGKYACRDKFEVAEIGYDDNERISRLVITANGKIAYEWESGKKAKRPAAKKADTTKPEVKKAEGFEDLAKEAEEFFNKEDAVLCEECNKTIVDTAINGKTYKKADIIYGARKKYGKTLCMECALKHKDEKAG